MLNVFLSQPILERLIRRSFCILSFSIFSYILNNDMGIAIIAFIIFDSQTLATECSILML